MIDDKSLIGKKVFSLYSCEDLGVVTNLYISNKYKLRFLELSSKLGKYILESKHIKSYANDSIIIKNSSFVVMKENMELTLANCNNFLGLEVYTVTGKKCGEITNLNFDDKFNLINFETCDNTFDKARIFNISKDICLVNDESLNIKISNCRPRSVPKPKARLENITVKVASPTTSLDKEESKIKANPFLTKPQLSDTSILIDRICTKAITSNNGEVICRANSRISYDIVKKARLFGKLYELIKYSK